MSGPSSASDGKRVKPIPFVAIDDASGEFQVNPQACDLLSQIRGKVVIMAVAGLYRTGKSFLLNLLVRHAKGIQSNSKTLAEEDPNAASMEEEGFTVGGTINACTKGIWMWGEPVVMEDGTNVIFLDTEGLGSIDRGTTYDTRIFALALLLASSFIYNSRGVIDGNAIEDLSLVVNLSKHIQTSSQNANNAASGSDLHAFFPSFMWVVRDFTLQLQENGKKISSKQYLENALKPQGGLSADASQKDQIRLLLADFFRQRDCVTLVRPVDNEEKLRILPQIPFGELRDEFRSSFTSLHRKLFDKAKPKMLFGKMLNGAMFVSLVKSYVEALNSGKAPVISSAWSRVLQSQCEDALQDAIEYYRNEMQKRVRGYESASQFEQDRANELAKEGGGPDEVAELEIVDHGQGDNAMFDEFGNLRVAAVQEEAPVRQDSMDDVGGDDESEMIQVMEEHVREDDDEANKKVIEHVCLPCNEDDLLSLHKLCKKLAKNRMRGVIDADLNEEMNEYMEVFRTKTIEIYESFCAKNAAASMEYCRYLLEYMSKEFSKPSAKSSSRELFSGTQKYLQDFLPSLHDKYYSKAVGPSIDGAYCEFMSQQVLSQVIGQTEICNTVHLRELRQLEKELSDYSVQVAVAQGQANAMLELANQQKMKCELSLKETEQRYENEILALRSNLDFKTNELEHVLNHNATLKKLADTAQQGQFRASEYASNALQGVLAGYLLKQQSVGGGGGAAKTKWYQRYFVLNGSQLFCYDTKEDYERCRADNPPMDVTGATIEDNFAVPEAFGVMFADNSYFPLTLHAKTVESRKEWVKSLRKAAAAGASTGPIRKHSSGASATSASSASFRSPTGYNRSPSTQSRTATFPQYQQHHQQQLYNQNDMQGYPQHHQQHSVSSTDVYGQDSNGNRRMSSYMTGYPPPSDEAEDPRYVGL